MSAVCLLLSSPAARADLVVDQPPDPVLVGAGIVLGLAALSFGFYLVKRRKAKKVKSSSGDESDSK